MKRFLTLFLTVLILLPGMSQAQQVADGNLQNCIGAAAGKPFESLSNEDYLNITRLNCTGRSIKNVIGIVNLANLDEIDLMNNRISDISPFADLSRLRKLYLWSNSISDITPLASLKQLEELYLSGNEIGDIRPLAKLNMLEELLLSDNQIADLGPVAGLTNLSWLEIKNNSVSDITPLAKLTRLEYLDASGNSISDVSVLSNLDQLSRLFLNGNSITDIKAMAGLKSLKTLFLGYNQVKDIGSLARLSELKILDFSSNRIDDIAALRNLANLQRLTLDNNLVSNISPLSGLANLSHVSLLNNCVNNAGALAQVKSVTGMEYQHNLCSSPNLVRKPVTKEWLNEQISQQCIAYGEKDYSLRNEYDYFSDGIYYMYYPRNEQGEFKKGIVCRVPWGSQLKNFLLPFEKTEETGKNYEIYKYGNNDKIFVQNGRIKGHSEKWRGSLKQASAIKEIMEIFTVKYVIKKGIINNNETLLVNKEDHVIQEIMDGEPHTLQFFEPDFYAAEISQEK